MKLAKSITVEELVEGYESIFANESFRANMPVIWDVSHLDITRIPVSEIQRLPGKLRGFMARRGTGYRAALVTTRAVDFQLLRIYLTILRMIGRNIEFRLFKSMNTAYEWVEQRAVAA